MSVISPEFSTDEVKARVKLLKDSLWLNFKAPVDDSVLIHEIGKIIEEKISDHIYQFLRDWHVASLVSAADLIIQSQVKKEPASTKEEPLSKKGKLKEKMN